MGPPATGGVVLVPFPFSDLSASKFRPMTERDGKPHATIMTPEEYRRRSNASLVEERLFETQIGSRVERFGNVAQVRSVYEMRRLPDAWVGSDESIPR